MKTLIEELRSLEPSKRIEESVFKKLAIDAIEKASNDPQVIKARKEMTLYAKKDPTLALARVSMVNGIAHLNKLLVKVIDRAKGKPSNMEIRKMLEQTWRKMEISGDFLDMFMNYATPFIKKVIEHLAVEEDIQEEVLQEQKGDELLAALDNKTVTCLLYLVSPDVQIAKIEGGKLKQLSGGGFEVKKGTATIQLYKNLGEYKAKKEGDNDIRVTVKDLAYVIIPSR